MRNWLLLLLAGLFLLTACAGGGQDGESTLTIGILPDVDSIPLVIAQEKGFFKEAGLKVKLVAFKSALDRDSALQSGQLDGAVSDVLAAAFARDGGFDAVIVSSTTGSYKLLAGRTEKASSLKELRNKDVAISKNTVIEYVTDRMLTESGLRPDDIRKVVIPQIPARLEMLSNDKVAAAVLPEPLATVARQNGARFLGLSDPMPFNIGIMLFTSRAVAQKAPELKALYRAYDQAVDYLYNEPVDSYIDIVIERCGFPSGVRGALALPAYRKAAPPSPADIADAVGWLSDRGLVKRTYSYEELVDSRPVRP